MTNQKKNNFNEYIEKTLRVNPELKEKLEKADVELENDINQKNIVQKKIKEFRETFPYTRDYIGENNWGPIEQWLSDTLLQVSKDAYTEGSAYKGKAGREAYQLGFREGKQEGYNETLENLKEQTK